MMFMDVLEKFHKFTMHAHISEITLTLAGFYITKKEREKQKKNV